MIYIGIDVGGTNMAVGLVDECGKILLEDSTPTKVPRPYGEMVYDAAMLALELVKRGGYTLEDIDGVGIGVPGVCDPQTGIVPFCTNLDWHDVPLVAEIRKYIDKPIVVDNDATVAGLAEAVAGASVGAKNSVMITLGTGVGSGIVIDGKVYSGTHGIGSEFGHTILKMDGEPCTCGNNGCFERYASATALIREGRKAYAQNPKSLIGTLCGGDAEKINAKVVVDAAKQGDETAQKVFRDYVKALAFGIINIINLLDPEVIVLGGGVSKAGDFLLEAVREAIVPLRLFKTMPYGRVELAKLGSEAGIIGAAMLCK